MNQRPNRLFLAPWIALSISLTACASSMATSKPEDPRGLIDLNARMPVGDSPYGIAYGAPTPARVRPLAPDIDGYLKAPSKHEAAKQPMVVARAVPLTPVTKEVQAAPVAQVLPAFEPVVNLEPNQEQLLAMAAEPPAPVSGDDSSRYSDREAKNQNLEKFRGGDAIVITSGALIIILLVVILVLLLT